MRAYTAVTDETGGGEAVTWSAGLLNLSHGRTGDHTQLCTDNGDGQILNHVGCRLTGNFS